MNNPCPPCPTATAEQLGRETSGIPPLIIGPATLYHGDCFDILPSLTGIDAVVTDPPFGIGFASHPTKWQRLAGQKPEAWDNTAPDVSSLLKIAPVVVIWGGNYFALPPMRGWQTWYKPDAPPSMGNVEMAWTNVDRTAKCIVHSISATNAERVGHPTQKPLAVMLFSLRTAKIEPGMTVLDPFMGSGTTGVAAIMMGCKFIGIERDPLHFATAVRRITEAAAPNLLTGVA